MTNCPGPTACMSVAGGHFQCYHRGGTCCGCNLTFASWDFTRERLEEIRTAPREAMIAKQEAQRLVDAMLRQMRTPNNGLLSIEEATGKPAFADNVSLVEWINADKICPPDRTNVLVYGGIAQLHKDTGVWFTQMEHPERPIQWKVTHWAYIPKPSQSLINSASRPSVPIKEPRPHDSDVFTMEEFERNNSERW